VTRLAIVVSHPIQYYVPLYERLARRNDFALRVFFTWHDGRTAVQDRGFGIPVSWDIPMTRGYDSELVPNTSSNPGTHHFTGLRNPSLVDRVIAWRPDIVHLTGWGWLSHLAALWSLSQRGIPVVFRGDSHLLDGVAGARWWIKRSLLQRVFSWPAGFLVTGAANRSYFEAFGVEPARLTDCPHSIDVARFAESDTLRNRQAATWREELGIRPDQVVMLFAGKFEPKKRPVELMRAVEVADSKLVLLMLGDGELRNEVTAIAAASPQRFRVLPFENQSRMPIVYRLGDVFVLPSAFGETWGLAVNEALACGRPVVVSDRVGCAHDVVTPSCGRVFPSNDLATMLQCVQEITSSGDTFKEMCYAASVQAWKFDVSETERSLVGCLDAMSPRGRR
jgi:glycosyltransferase involved in cell wall biosynthesis